ncbi:putative multidrug efflux pump [Escherichia coli]|uniref:Putative multidrug efflux pump n=1 Tax=Escherichia coli TaxID=562 RepID=A0A377C7B8_ECOLX|nr:putative multidrug efflux pump [Escherichia coli]
MVPFSAFATSRWETGSPRLERYNGYSAVEIVGEAAPGVSTGTAMDIMESLVKQLPNGFGLEWTAMSYQGATFRRAGSGAVRHFLAGGIPGVWRRCMKAGRCRSR